MDIQIIRTGGFTGVTLQADVETSQLEPGERDEVARLFNETAFFSLPEKIEALPGGYDRFQYEITVHDAGHSHTVTLGDTGMSEALHALANLVLRLGRQSR